MNEEWRKRKEEQRSGKKEGGRAKMIDLRGSK
jgi:hypothetical protein